MEQKDPRPSLDVTSALGAPYEYGATTRSHGPAPRVAILVLGMHRSGTSALTRVLSLLGATLPRTVLPAGRGNEKGHWEPDRVWRLNDEILASAGSDVTDWRPLNPFWMETGAAVAFRQRAVTLLEEEFGDVPLLVIKDPRLCRIVPFWVDALKTWGAEVACVLSVRNPLEVAASLRDRDGTSLPRAAVTWLRYVLDAESATRFVPRVLVRFEDLLGDWRQVSAKISTQLGAVWPRMSSQSEVEIDQFLDHHLRHHSMTGSDLEAHPAIGDWVKTAYQALVALCDESHSERAERQLDAVRSEVDRAGRALGAVLREEEVNWERWKAERAGLRERCQALESAVTERDQRLAGGEERAKAQGEELALLRSEYRRLEQELESQGSSYRGHASLQEARIETLEQLLSNAESRAAGNEKEISQLRAKLASTEQERDALQASVEQGVSREKALGLQWKALQDRASEMEKSALRQQADACGLAAALEEERTEKQVLTSHARETEETLSRILPQQRMLARRLASIQSTGSWELVRPLLALEACCSSVVRVPAGIAKLVWWIATGRLLWRLRVRRQVLAVQRAGVFDAMWYAETNPDVVAMGWNPVLHWITTGWREGREPKAGLSITGYLEREPKIREGGIDLLLRCVADKGK